MRLGRESEKAGQNATARENKAKRLMGRADIERLVAGGRKLPQEVGLGGEIELESAPHGLAPRGDIPACFALADTAFQGAGRLEMPTRIKIAAEFETGWPEPKIASQGHFARLGGNIRRDIAGHGRQDADHRQALSRGDAERLAEIGHAAPFAINPPPLPNVIA